MVKGEGGDVVESTNPESKAEFESESELVVKYGRFTDKSCMNHKS